MFYNLKDKAIVRSIKKIQRDIKKYHISAYASSAAFFTFLSLIPMLLVFFSIIPYTPITKATLMQSVHTLFPQSAVPFAINMIEEMYHKTGAYLSISIIVTLWSAGKGTLALIRALNTLHNVEEQRNYFVLRLKACIYTFILLLSIVILLVLVVFGEKIVKGLTELMPHLFFFFDTVLQIRILFVLAVLTIFFCIVYTYLPETSCKRADCKKRECKNSVKRKGRYFCANAKRSIRRKFPGAFLTSVLWYLSSWLFSEYINRFSAFSTYGNMTTVVIIMFWLYLCFYIILLGELFNHKSSIVKKELHNFLVEIKEKDKSRRLKG